jgi:AhpD family alkylhydroperoxidase
MSDTTPHGTASPDPVPHDHGSHDQGGRYGRAVADELRPLARELRQAIPDTYRGFAEFHKGAFAAGALDVRTKELIALAIAVTERCDGCIAAHAASLARAGGTRQQAAEAIGVAMLMTGGPGTVYGPRAYAAVCEHIPATEPDAGAGG